MHSLKNEQHYYTNLLVFLGSSAFFCFIFRITLPLWSKSSDITDLIPDLYNVCTRQTEDGHIRLTVKGHSSNMVDIYWIQKVVLIKMLSLSINRLRWRWIVLTLEIPVNAYFWKRPIGMHKKQWWSLEILLGTEGGKWTKVEKFGKVANENSRVGQHCKWQDQKYALQTVLLSY